MSQKLSNYDYNSIIMKTELYYLSIETFECVSGKDCSVECNFENC